ncbi:MAG TPA: hypothetical protein PKY05_06815 [Fibrobacteria bacterium]|nr:hypothetical protein [Fibrobacteria bacterium]
MKTITINKIEFALAADGTVGVQPSQHDPIALARATQKLVKRLADLKRRAESKRKEAFRKAAKKAAQKERKAKKMAKCQPKQLEQIHMSLGDA